MDINELRHHAKRHGSWTIQLSATQTLSCGCYNTGARTEYRYRLNGVLITPNKAQEYLTLAFERSMA